MKDGIFNERLIHVLSPEKTLYGPLHHFRRRRDSGRFSLLRPENGLVLMILRHFFYRCHGDPYTLDLRSTRKTTLMRRVYPGRFWDTVHGVERRTWAKG